MRLQKAHKANPTIQFLMVYISEPPHFGIPGVEFMAQSDPKDETDRVARIRKAAKAKGITFPIALDDGTLEKEWTAFPLRLLVVKDGVVAYDAGHGLGDFERHLK